MECCNGDMPRLLSRIGRDILSGDVADMKDILDTFRENYAFTKETKEDENCTFFEHSDWKKALFDVLIIVANDNEEIATFY
jgi:hypothetical protein